MNNEEKVYIAVDKDLCENIDICCCESGVEFDDVVDYGLRFILNNYIDNRNKRYARMTPTQIMDIYPEMDEETATRVIEFAKDDSLAIIKPVALPKGSYSKDDLVGVTGVVGSKMLESASRLMANEHHGYYPDHFFAPNEEDYYEDEEDKCGDIINLPPNESPEAILPTLGSLIDRAHHVNVNIQVVMNDND